jgi:hypothetical protein
LSLTHRSLSGARTGSFRAANPFFQTKFSARSGPQNRTMVFGRLRPAHLALVLRTDSPSSL